MSKPTAKNTNNPQDQYHPVTIQRLNKEMDANADRHLEIDDYASETRAWLWVVAILLFISSIGWGWRSITNDHRIDVLEKQANAAMDQRQYLSAHVMDLDNWKSKFQPSYDWTTNNGIQITKPPELFAITNTAPRTWSVEDRGQVSYWINGAGFELRQEPFQDIRDVQIFYPNGRYGK